MLTRLLAHAARALPSQCAVCRSWGFDQVCPACTTRFSSTTLRCATCALPLAGSASQCGECLLHSSALDACLAAVDYGYPWDGLLAQLKFKGQHGPGADAAVARALAQTMRPLAAIQTALKDADFIVPIPLSPARLRQRGFNQALEITKHLLRPSHDWPHIASAKLHPQLLLRIRDTTAQTGLPLHAARLRGASIVLVDDVTTTTATLCAAALALRSAGAARVVGVVFARTPAPG
jgi:ComF family protein